ncbi:FIG00553650: hypothetical protein [Cronobacter muytjensii 530]|nr:hypothetical protein BN133_3626 [Cronobacter dublinensis 582]
MKCAQHDRDSQKNKFWTVRLGTQKQIGFQTIKQPDSARRERKQSLTTTKAISVRG